MGRFACCEYRGYQRLKKPGILLAALLLLVCQPALAAKRVALVLGNSAYQNVAPLPNPVHDGAVIAAKLKEAGFDIVDSRHDLTAAETRRVLREFADRASDADIAVIYYAGHGMEVDGTNYLIPVDARLERDTDVFDEAFSLDRMLVAIEPAKQLRLVILDACRDNPFATTMKRTAASRSIGRGLARIEPSSPNTLISYSARAGSTALDGDSGNSPFTLALARHLTTPGLDVRKAFGFVRDDVLKATGSRQEPFVYGSLGGDDLPLVPAKAGPAPAAANAQFEARRDYELALQLGNKDAFNAFLAQYPDGFYARLARLQLDKIADQAHLAATGKARQARAETDAKATAQARIAAEKVRRLVPDPAPEPDRKRVGSEAAEELPEKVAAANAAMENAAAGSRSQAEAAGDSFAALSAGPPPTDLARSVQAELRRVGCLAATAVGEWNAASQRSLSLFNRYAGTNFDIRLASPDALDAIRLKSSRVCPPAPGQAVVAPQASGQIVCDTGGCRPVEPGCHLEFRATWQGGPREGGGGNVQVCD